MRHRARIAGSSGTDPAAGIGCRFPVARIQSEGIPTVRVDKLGSARAPHHPYFLVGAPIFLQLDTLNRVRARARRLSGMSERYAALNCLARPENCPLSRAIGQWKSVSLIFHCRFRV